MAGDPRLLIPDYGASANRPRGTARVSGVEGPRSVWMTSSTSRAALLAAAR